MVRRTAGIVLKLSWKSHEDGDPPKGVPKKSNPKPKAKEKSKAAKDAKATKPKAKGKSKATKCVEDEDEEEPRPVKRPASKMNGGGRARSFQSVCFVVGLRQS